MATSKEAEQSFTLQNCTTVSVSFVAELLAAVMFLCILLSGDVELNPGPKNGESHRYYYNNHNMCSSHMCNSVISKTAWQMELSTRR